MRNKRVLLVLLTVVATIIIVGIAISVFRRDEKALEEENTQSVLYDVNVTNLQTRGAEKMNSVSDDFIYGKKLTGVKNSLDLSSMETKEYVSAVYQLQELYRDDIDGLFHRLNTRQLQEDGVTDFTVDTMKSYLVSTLGDPNDISLFALKTYESKQGGYTIVQLCSAERQSGEKGNVLYAYDRSKDVRFTFWLSGEDFLFVPYSVMEGASIGIIQTQDHATRPVNTEESAGINGTEIGVEEETDDVEKGQKEQLTGESDSNEDTDIEQE